METKRKALGRGLEQLFNNEAIDLEVMEKNIIDGAKKGDIVELQLDNLRSNPYQPRKHFDEDALKEMAASISQYGVLQPIIVRESIKGYDIIAGERRVKASILAGKRTIPSIIKEFTDQEMMEIALLENIQRENLSSIEEAEALKNILDSVEMTQEELATKIGKSRSYITNMLGLLRLPATVQKLVSSKAITMGHARAISKLESADKMEELATKVIIDDLNVRQVEDLVKSADVEKRNPIVKKTVNNEYTFVQSVLREKIGTMVKVSSKKIEIPFDSEKDLERILEILKIDIKER